ncbi:hypothetical protein JF50_03215 [Pseudoalteromonas luteoviolacea]|uniref:Uncharacterized protein n=1 Tax=Pseudoalteromonas luteoviolacea TaxID=43657 RepID=A0A0C1QHM2_9GAMM|nr:hypothetical protein JF50_03215 [Pseudoalteromonas luteoviolacea]
MPNKVVNAGHEVKNSYVLHHIPEQSEDIFVLLISGSYILNIELNRFDAQEEPVIERVELNDYLHGLSKIHQIQIAVALDLARA